MARMRGQMVRFGHRQWALIQHRADIEEISASQLVRDTSYAASVWGLALEAEAMGVKELAERLRHLEPEIARCFEAVTGTPLPAELLDATDGHRPS